MSWMLVWMGACVADRVLLGVPVEVEPAVATVTPGDGVEITVTRATVTLQDLRLEGPADTTASVWPSLWPISSAHAHPGHDFEGGLQGELAGTWAVDLLVGVPELGLADCYDGAYATARFRLPAGAAVQLEGTARVDGTDRSFALEVFPDREITGIPFEVTMAADAPPTRMVLTSDLTHALSFVDWRTPDGDADGVLTTADGALENTVTFGVVSTPAWTLTLED